MKILVAITRAPAAPPTRRRFFARFALPSITAAASAVGADVLVYNSDEHVCAKRQRALEDARRGGFRWVYHCDDDVVLASDALDVLRSASQRAQTPAVTYTDYTGVCLPGGGAHPKGPVFHQESAAWDRRILSRRNLVSTMSLFDVEQLARAGVAWDPRLDRFQDWDVALQIAAAGLVGLYVPSLPMALFHAYYVTPGITARVPYERAIAALRAKHPEVRG